jgi:hypothetical protein
MNALSTRPEHIVRISRIVAGYWSRLTPQKSPPA